VQAGPGLANEESDCDHIEGPLKAILRSTKKRLTFWNINVSLENKIKWSIFTHFVFTFSQSINFFISFQKINQSKLN
jgi:hypothetical protein